MAQVTQQCCGALKAFAANASAGTFSAALSQVGPPRGTAAGRFATRVVVPLQACHLATDWLADAEGGCRPMSVPLTELVVLLPGGLQSAAGENATLAPPRKEHTCSANIHRVRDGQTRGHQQTVAQ